MPRLNPKEIEAIVGKIRQRHDEGAVRYGGAGFNRKAFDDRYLRALRDRIDLQTFVFAEVGALEELVKRAEKAEEEIRIRSELGFTKKIEAMLEGMSDRIRAYPALAAEADLPEEVNHFAGGLKVFLNGFWYPLRTALAADDLKNLKAHSVLTDRIQRFCVHSAGRMPYEVEKFLLDEEKNGTDRARMAFLREAALCLRGVAGILEGMPDSVAAGAAREAAERLIADFRFGDFV